MKLKLCDVVLIIPLQKKGLIMSLAFDISSREEKYVVHVSDEEPDYICQENELKYLTTFEDEFDRFIEENQPISKA